MSIAFLPFLLAALVMAIAAVRAHLALTGLMLATVVTLPDPSGEDWRQIALSALLFIIVMLLVPLRQAGVVARGTALAVLSTSLALHSGELAARLMAGSGWQLTTAIGIVVVTVSLTPLCVAAANKDAASLLPFACVGAVALPAQADPFAMAWGFVGVLLLMAQGPLRRRRAAKMEHKAPTPAARLAQ